MSQIMVFTSCKTNAKE